MLNYQIQGQGSPVLLIHGLFGSLENLNSIARALNEKYQVISIDLPNHGRSYHSEHLSYEMIAGDIDELRKHLTIEKWHILGHSMGGKSAMQYALQHPKKVEKLIVADISPVSYQGSNHSNVFNGLNAVPLNNIHSRKEAYEHLSKHVVEEGVRQFLLKSLYKTDTGFNWRFNVQLLADEYKTITGWPDSDLVFTGDVLFIKGQNSDYILPEHRENVLKHFPNSQAKVIHNTGHWLHAEKPSAFNRLVEQFLAE